MKVKIKREVLNDGLSKVSRALSAKNLVPVLLGIKFDLTKKGLLLTASDNDITIQVLLDSKDNMEIEKEGSIIIQGRYIIDIVKKLPSEYINIEVVDDLKILVSTENSEFNLNGISKSEYPNITMEKTKKPIVIKNNIFKDIINQTSYAASHDESRPILTGINFNISDNELEINATDSYRLAKKVLPIVNPTDEIHNIVIPSRNVVEFTKITPDSDENIEMHIFSNKIVLEFENILFQSRLINGSYPNTSNLIPSESLFEVNLNVFELYNMIDRASILNSDREKNIVTLETKDNYLIIKSVSAEVGRVEEKMIVEKNNKEDIKISFVAKYMMDALKVLPEEVAVISFVGEIKPIVVKNENSEDLIQLVLPIRTY